mgnify:CR=1 FL=1
MTKSERAARNAAIVRLAKQEVSVSKIAKAFELSQQMVYNIINKAKAAEAARLEISRIRKEETKKWIERTVQNNKRTHVRLTDVVKGICTQILRLYEGEDAIEMIDCLETTVSNVYAFDYCQTHSITNYCAAKKDCARKELKK